MRFIESFWACSYSLAWLSLGDFQNSESASLIPVLDFTPQKIPTMLVLGGTFDPIHRGHTHAAMVAAKELNQPVRLMLTPNARLRNQAIGSLKDRWNMLRIACSESEELIPSDFEFNGEVHNRTFETLMRLSHQKTVHVVWIIGSDVLHRFHHWYRADDLTSLLSLYVFRRPSFPLPPLPESFQKTDQATDLVRNVGHIYISQERMLNIQASEIRNDFQSNSGPSTDASSLIHPGVYEYIISKKLYHSPL